MYKFEKGEKEMIEVGIIQNKFHIFHFKHMEHILTAKMRCKKLIIGISDPETKEPFSYYERMSMISDSLKEFGLKREEFEIVPFPMGEPEKLSLYAPLESTVFMSDYDEKSEQECEVLEHQNFKVKVLWRKSEEEEKITEKEIKTCILNGEEWKQFVPKIVYEYAVSHDIKSRLAE